MTKIRTSPIQCRNQSFVAMKGTRHEIIALNTFIKCFFHLINMHQLILPMPQGRVYYCPYFTEGRDGGEIKWLAQCRQKQRQTVMITHTRPHVHQNTHLASSSPFKMMPWSQQGKQTTGPNQCLIITEHHHHDIKEEKIRKVVWMMRRGEETEEKARLAK